MEEFKSIDIDKIKVFSSEDDKLKILGELLSNKSSRDIIKLLVEKEMYTNEIAKKLDLRISLVIHHLQKMESIGLLEITHKRIIRKGEEHRFFRIPKSMLILPNESKENIDDRLFKRIFRSSIKFVAIAVVGVTVWLSNIANYSETEVVYPVPYAGNVPTDPLIPALIVVIIGLVIERIIWTIKKKRR